MLRISPSAQAVLLEHQSDLFRQYDYFGRLSSTDHQPLKEPINNFREALLLLYQRHNDSTRRILDLKACFPDGTVGPGIRIKIYRGGYGGDCFSGEYLFPVLSEAVRELIHKGVLNEMPKWGRFDGTAFCLNDRACEAIFEVLRAFEKGVASNVPSSSETA